MTAPRSSALVVRPLTLRAANEFVLERHRHHGPVRGCMFSIGCWLSERLVGVAIVGRPVARLFQDGETAEVTRLCSDGTANVCSRLLGAVTRACAAIGVRRVVSYTLAEERGAAWRAANWRLDGTGIGGGGLGRVKVARARTRRRSSRSSVGSGR